MADIDKIEEEMDEKEIAEAAANDPLWYSGEGDLLDTAEGRAKFCKLSKTSIYRKRDPMFPADWIEVYVVQGESLLIRKRCKADKSLVECIEYDAEGEQTNKFFDQYVRFI